MSGKIYSVDGTFKEVEERIYLTLPQRMQNAGIKMYKHPDGEYVILSQSNIIRITHTPEPVVEVKPKPVVEVPPEVEEPKEEVKEEPKSLQERKDEAMADLMAKSNCKHEPEKMELYMTSTAKGVRYFPVCGFCGKRERYVSEKKILEGAYAGTPHEKWTEADLANAKPWTES